MSKKAILFSAQNFTDPFEPQLKGCENDTKLWKKVLGKSGFNVKEPYKDLEADEALKVFSSFIKKLKAGDTGVIFYSGHSVNVYSGKIGEDSEALIFKDQKRIYEFQILKKLSKLNKKAKLILIADCCYARGLKEYRSYAMIGRVTGLDFTKREAIPLQYRNTDKNANFEDIIDVTVNVSALRGNISSIPERILIPDVNSDKSFKDYDASSEIKKIIEQTHLQKDNFFTSDKGILVLPHPQEIDNTVTAKGKLENIANKNNFKFPTTRFKKINDYENVTLMVAEESIANKAYERFFNKKPNDIYEKGHYGVFSYYATKEILKNNSISYKKLKEKVNKKLEKESDRRVKQQRMAFDSGNTNWNRKLFT